MSTTSPGPRRWLASASIALAMLGAGTGWACDEVVSADLKTELPGSPDRSFSCVTFPWLDPDSPITNPGLGALLFYQSRCTATPILMVRRGDTVEMIGGGSCGAGSTVSGCLPIAMGANTVQDDWAFTASSAVRVRIGVDVMTVNAACPTTVMSCAVAPDPLRGPLEPKLALYPPGVLPTPGPFNGHQSAADCAVAVTGDTGCLGPGRDPSRDCLVCDNTDCTVPGLPAGSCASFEVDLPVAGSWTVSVAPQPPAFVDFAEGCYALTVEVVGAGTIGALGLVRDDAVVTFLTAEPDRR